MTNAAGGKTAYAYTGPATAITGPTGVQRILQSNGLGALAAVCEVTNLSGAGDCGLDAAGSGYLTTYSYDPLGDLTGVNEAGQTRSFAYDALGRITARTAPTATMTWAA